MKLWAKLVLAEAPLLVAVVLVGGVAVAQISRLSAHAEVVFEDNYRSVLAAQRMGGSAERIDRALLEALAGRIDQARLEARKDEERLEGELRIQENNITEPGEAELTRQLRQSWDAWRPRVDRFLADPGPQGASTYFDDLDPAYQQVRHAADEVLGLNQDAIVTKNERMRRTAARTSTVLLVLTLLATAGGVLASLVLTSRLARPISRLGMAARRIAGGDLEVQAEATGSAEIAALATDFNAMAAKLREYRQSSLGELLMAQQASQAAIESIPDPVLIFGGGGALLGTNAAAESLLDASRTLVEPGLRETVDRVRTHVLGGKGAYSPRGFEEAVQLPAADGPRSFLPRGSPVYGERGEISGASVILQDVTRLRRFDEFKNDLVATVAHEFRTPLTSLRLAIHLCLEGAAGPLTEKQMDLLQAAREDCERLQSIVDDLLDLARLRSGRFELELEPIFPAHLLERASEEHASEAASHRVRVVVEPLLPERAVRADAGRLPIALDNLVTNAIRHAPEGSAVTLRAVQEDANIRFEVHDLGPGIPPEHVRAVFERFTRVPGSPPGGAGLGLSIARDIIEAHGGAIGVTSTPGQGSTFWFTVPLSETLGP